MKYEEKKPICGRYVREQRIKRAQSTPVNGTKYTTTDFVFLFCTKQPNHEDIHVHDQDDFASVRARA